MPTWLQREEAFLILGVVSVATFLLSLAVVPLLVIRMPTDYFAQSKPPPSSFRGRHPVIRWTVRLVKNLLGVTLVAGGLAMVLLPGQGLITILIGMTLVDFPGKRRLETWLVSRHRIARSLNWIRRKAGRPPLEPPEHDAG